MVSVRLSHPRKQRESNETPFNMLGQWENAALPLLKLCDDFQTRPMEGAEMEGTLEENGRVWKRHTRLDLSC